MFWFAILFVVRPHPDDLDGFDIVQNLVYEPVLDVDPTGEGAGKVTDQLFVWWWCLKGIAREDVEELLGLGLEARARQLFRVSLGLVRVDQSPVHQCNSLAHLSTGVFIPLTIESLIPGTPVR